MHFFTEPTKLDPQTNTDPFGPVNGFESDKYKISSSHKVNADAKIFAPQDSMMLVLPHIIADTNTVDSSLVNVVLKPTKGLDIPFPSVKYYILRGIDIHSFVSGGAITPSDPSNTEFIKDFWTKWTNYTTDLGISATPPPTPKSFGYDSSLSSSPEIDHLLESYFNSAESTNTTINDFQAIYVKEGMWIANVLSGKSVEFEVIVDTDHISMKIGYAELSQQIIDATGLTINASNPNLDAIAEREKILNYVDPSALYGMHQEIGLYLGKWSGTTKSPSELKKGKDVIDEILTTFLNKNVVYLDLRSERGYSYYYYQNYRWDALSGTTIQWSESFQLKSTSQTNFNYLDYASLKWPLINLNNPGFNLAAITQGDNIELKLLTNDNIEPLLFALNPKLFGATNKSNFIDSSLILDSSNPMPKYSLPITLFVSNYLDGSATKNFTQHLQLHFFRKKDNSASPNTVFKSSSVFNRAFGGIKMPEIVLNVKTPFQHIENTKRMYVTDGISFGYVAKNGVLQDSAQLLFYTEKEFSFKATTNTYPKFDPSLVPANDVDAILKLKNVILNKWQINNGTNNIDILGIIGYNRTTLEVTPKEDLLLLGITKTELTNLNTLSGVSDLHHKYFVLTELLDGSGNKFIDSISGNPYNKFRVDVQGINPTTGEVVIIDSSSLTNNVIVYGMSNEMLCSPDFGAASTVPIQLPDPGNYNDFKGSHKISYDGSTAMVTDLFPTGHVRITDNKMTFDNVNIPNSQDIDFEIKGDLYLPTDKMGSTKLSNAVDNFPIIAIAHANGGEYVDYEFLAKHLAINGFIVCAISALVDSRQKFNVFRLSDLPSSPVPPSSPSNYEEFQYYFNLTSFPGGIGIDTTKLYLASDTRYFNPYSHPSGEKRLKMYAYYDDPSNPSLNEKLFSLEYLIDSTTFRHPYTTSYGTSPSRFTFRDIVMFGGTRGTDFDIYIQPTNVQWKRNGGTPGTGLGKFGLKWLKNISSGGFSARISRECDRLVELTATDWALDTQAEIKNAIDTKINVTHVNIPFPNASINRYIGVLSEDVYYMIKINSSTSTSCNAGTCVEISTEVKNRQLILKTQNSIHGARILSRSSLILPHLQIVKKHVEEKFKKVGVTNRVQNNLGIIGHSRGAEAVVRFVHQVKNGSSTVGNFNWSDFIATGSDNRSTPTWNNLPDGLNNIKAVISLAPTDASDDRNEQILENIPYYVIYGSCEGDVIGYPQSSTPNRTSGFSIYDRTDNNTEKGMAFVYGATHKGFINNNNDFSNFASNYGSGGLTPELVTRQQGVTKAYMNAFMRRHLKNETIWNPFIFGDQIPASIGFNKIYTQYKNMDKPIPVSKWINDSETSSTSGAITKDPSTYAGSETRDHLLTLDHRTPHDTRGIEISWPTSSSVDGNFVFSVDASGKDVSSYDYLSFRIGMALNTSGNYDKLDELIIELKYAGMPGSGNYTRKINREIPEPYFRNHLFGDILTKTAMMTIRIPLSEFQTNGVDITKITAVQMTFPKTFTFGGNVLIDDMEFTN